MESDLTSVVNGISSPPGVLAPFHWTMSSPVAGLDSRLRSVGGDRAGNKKNSVKDVGGTKATGGLEAKKARVEKGGSSLRVTTRRVIGVPCSWPFMTGWTLYVYSTPGVRPET